MSRITAVPLPESTVTVSWACKSHHCSHTAAFTSVLGLQAAQARALEFVADSRRDTAYTLAYPDAVR